MIRDALGDKDYWDTWIQFEDQTIEKMVKQLEQNPGQPNYRPQFIYEIANEYRENLFQRYSRGDDIAELRELLVPIIDYWEKSELMGKEVWSKTQQVSRHSWEVNFDHYIVCFWLVGLAILLELPDAEWFRLINLVGNEGKDALLDLVIAKRSPTRKIGDQLCFDKPYRHLYEAVNCADKSKQTHKLYEFVKNWYSELRTIGHSSKKKPLPRHSHPYWYRFGDENFEGGAYFGRWCIEAAAVAKAFNIDDSLCLGHEHYPGDLLRPNGPTTHKVRQEDNSAHKKSHWLSRFFNSK
ncbi:MULTISPECIES: PoNe immunity protein domain-containing protein [unclassified Endozoicomonas]|uniref:PoNi-like cognate immunity protein n=1 Tax=unclassified Endozoicomonas TaxID=2644528 RepID=UPI003BB65552